MLTPNDHSDLEPTHIERPFEDADLNGQSKKTLQEFVSCHKDKWPNAAHGKLTNKTNMKMLCTVLLDQEHGFTIRIPLPDASNTDIQVEGHVPGTGNMGDFLSTPPFSMVIFNSVKAPGTPNGNMNSSFMSRGAGIFEDLLVHEHAGDLSLTTMDSLDLPSSPKKPFKRTHSPARQASFARAKNDPIKKAAKQQKTNQMVEWLVAELQKCPGYDEFCDSFHQVKHNPDAVRSWTFAVDFTKAFNRLTLINGSYKKIEKVEIVKALGIGNAWLFEAERAVQIVQKYSEGGANPSQPVIDKITYVDGDAEGSTKLLAWLKAWEGKHAM
ncbi:hypothetical protein PILCRDRAFT_4864 [Piloderma croceum F 1598]|uniref:Uncharacterized protein n=1 Tax=Piloderma croceum (strain F 1598) TaxID=765440 RepID=A0A0C3G6R6_PILCF|nr:hypothetical protein PILCRDRAFT_4864 [Piloderma croceum F 1598]